MRKWCVLILSLLLLGVCSFSILSAAANLSPDPYQLSEQVCQTTMNHYRAAALPPSGRWHYHQGVFLKGMSMVWERTGNDAYFEYIKKYVDSNITKDGRLFFNDEELDAVQAGLLLFPLYEKTGDERYKKAAGQLQAFLDGWKKNSLGGYWHKSVYPNQMWLDGLYMAGPFMMQYGKTFNRPELYDVVVHQAELMLVNNYDADTGLLKHAWSATGTAPWADPKTGQSPELWGRAMGWFVIALNEILDYLPQDHPKRQYLIDEQAKLLHAVIKYQDPKSGLWFQVLDRGEDPKNWQETSCSAMFVAAISKAVRKGYIEPECLQAAEKGWVGLNQRMVTVNSSGKVRLNMICVGTGVGDYTHYLNRNSTYDDLHGLGAFLFACEELGAIDKRQ